MVRLKRGFVVLCLSGLTNLAAANADDLGPTLRKIKDAGILTLGYRDNAIPLSYAIQEQKPNAEQKPVGFAVDLCGVIADKIKQRLDLAELKIDYKLATSANRATLIKDGTIDIECGPTAATAELRAQVAFSLPIYTAELKWIAPKRMYVEIEGSRWPRQEYRTPSSANDLKNKAVALTHGSGATSLVLTISNDRTLGLSILEGKDNADSFRLLEMGKVFAFLADDILLVSLKAAARYPDNYGFLDESYPSAGSAYSLMIRKDDPQFKELVDGVLAETMKSGDYAKIYSKWFENPIPPKNLNLAYPMPEKLKQYIKNPTAQLSDSAAK